MTTFDEVINFYKQFNRYKTNTYEELYNHIIQSINYNQYKIFKDKGLYGFTNWAFVNQQTEDKFLNTGIIDNWNCGDIMLHIDFIATKNVKQIMSWLKNNSAKLLGLNKKIHWVRLDNDNKVRKIMKQTTKGSWLWVE
jgi:hemolysin-activating ACP:hemolysin acyltransferase|nr:ACP:hemolysin acyltransferase (hemolysin-activating protein) (HlyC) [uncultured Mediterranean phage uvMED]|tara:strand:+ start:78 stop:491 length:414 start_codon:yes stop_codon:yes gene_type:complete